jgi:hypothetical protein
MIDLILLHLESLDPSKYNFERFVHAEQIFRGNAWCFEAINSFDECA